MKNSKEFLGGTGQSTANVKPSSKHDANLQKNSSLYFQIGLILCLLGTYALFEMQFVSKHISMPTETAYTGPITLDYVKPYVVEVVKPEAPKPLPSVDLIDVVKVIDNDALDVTKIIKTTEEPVVLSKPATVGEIPKIEEPIEDIVVDFIRIEKVPVYPGCENQKTNEKRRQCMSDKISKLVSKKFNADLAADYGLTGKQKIFTQFTIDKTGAVNNIKIRAPHNALEKEANRIINKIPQMQPGMQRDKPVGVVYTLPIVFEVQQ